MGEGAVTGLAPAGFSVDMVDGLVVVAIDTDGVEDAEELGSGGCAAAVS